MLTYERYCDEIVRQSTSLYASIDGADLTTPVPTCPGWNVGQLLRHIGSGQRWMDTIVRTRATEPLPGDSRELSEYRDEDPAVVGPWLVEGAESLAAALRESGQGGPAWTPLPMGGTDFTARRATYETAVHRADAVLALGEKYSLDTDLAVDAIDEWMELMSIPMALQMYPEKRRLLGPGRTVHLHATDTDAEWVIDLTGDVITWRRAHEKSAVALRGPVLDLLLIVYRRKPARIDGVQILGDEQLMDAWLEQAQFGT
nr:maleylpyruvate isomerase family mycothiol-dependent enzyme [Kibdelosporangium sp. MJ126-NF4]CEL22298.1 hypothetical protein [Kibdelosporangium sp. MJ126-NF4]CTQ93079.1 hypothetical protein [Kibdelosporangium sp. MJ126-NF4]